MYVTYVCNQVATKCGNEKSQEQPTLLRKNKAKRLAQWVSGAVSKTQLLKQCCTGTRTDK